VGNKPIPIRLPEELKALVQDSLDEGETFADFTREALRRELKRRGQKSKSPAVRRGRPPKDK
jgi:Arc/MetJ-type ribon-helix-helix transcriptional regulator